MFEAALDILSGLGILDAIRMAAIALVAIFLFKYFIDRG